MHHLFRHYVTFLSNNHNFHFLGAKRNRGNNNFNASCSLVLIIPEAACGVYAPLESRALHMVWSWKLHQRYSLKKGDDWWCHYHVPHVYFSDWKTFFLTLAKAEKLCQWTSLVKRTYWWKFQNYITSWSQNIVWSLFFLI